MKTLLKTSLAASLVMALAGCIYEPDYVRADGYGDAYYGTGVSYGADDGYDSDGYDGGGYYDGGYDAAPGYAYNPWWGPAFGIGLYYGGYGGYYNHYYGHGYYGHGYGGHYGHGYPGNWGHGSWGGHGGGGGYHGPPSAPPMHHGH